jgi:hypothetical protein
MKRSLILVLMFVVGACVGVGGAFAAWRPYGEGSLTRAILRKCGIREAPRGEDRCSVLVDDALDAWFQQHYAGANTTALPSLDSGVDAVQPAAAPDSAVEARAEDYARTHPICRVSIGVRMPWLRGFRGHPELFRDATDTTYLRATHDAYRAGADYRIELAARPSKP